MRQHKGPQPVPAVDAEDNKKLRPDEGSSPEDDQAWFWTPSWQAGEAEADWDIASGRVTDLGPEDIQARIRELETGVTPRKGPVSHWHHESLAEGHDKRL